MNIQWFPGHMMKTQRAMMEDIKLIDIVIEIVDARLPLSSRNPQIDEIVGNKPRLLLLNKADIADASVTSRWEKYFASKDIPVMVVSSTGNKKLNNIFDKCREILKDKIARQKEKGIANRSIKVIVVGVPNVGKSSLINKLSGRKSAITGDRPGVTRGKQWIRLGNGIELMDIPGILWPKFDDELVGKKLAFTGAIKDEIMDVETLAAKLLECLLERCPEGVVSRYKLSTTSFENGFEALEAVARKRGFIISGGEVDIYRAAHIVLDEFRSTKIGRITLESPEGAEQNEPC